MVATAILRYARCTPMKARRVADLVRGKNAAEAMVALRFMPYRAAKIVEKLLKSAMANAEQKQAVDPEELRIEKIFVDHGPMMKRVKARSMGRATVVRKRLSHITLHLSDDRAK